MKVTFVSFLFFVSAFSYGDVGLLDIFIFRNLSEPRVFLVYYMKNKNHYFVLFLGQK